MSQSKTINLQNEEVEVKFDKPYLYVWCINLGDTDVLFSENPNMERGQDNVMIVKPGYAVSIGDIGVPSVQTIYVQGKGEVQILGRGSADSPFKTAAKGGDIKLGGLVEHATGSAGWYIKTNGCSKFESDSEHNIVYYAVAEHLQIYVKAEDDSNECKFIWSKSDKRDVTSTYPNEDLVGKPVTDVVNGFVTAPAGAKWICFSQRIDDTETGVYKLLS